MTTDKTYSETPDIVPIPAHRKEVLSHSQLEMIKNGTLLILSEVGVHFPSQKALTIFADSGANVDWESEIVRIPPQLVSKAMSTAPRSFILGGREERFDLTLDGKNSYLNTDGCGVHVIDLETRQQRPSRKDDVAMMARVCDSLPLNSFFWPMVSAQDHPISPSLHELDASFNNTLKHVQTPTLVEEITTRYAVEMAKVVAGSEDEMRKRPPLTLLICTIAPLAIDAESMDSALVAAEAGIPVGFMSMPNTGSTGPATLTGTMSQGDAEIVSAMVLIQMAYPGAPIYHSFMPGMTHPRTGAYYSHDSHVYAIDVELAHMWGVPTLAGMGGTDAHGLGWESGNAGVKSQLLGTLCGAETGSGMGLLRGSTVLYPEALVLEGEIYHNVCNSLAGLDTSPGYLALDIIREVGPRGHFLGEKHTRDHFRNMNFSEIVYIPDSDGSYQDPLDVAREKTVWILENHHPESLSEEQQTELTKIIKAAEKELTEEE